MTASWRTTLCGILGILAAGITMVAVPLLDNDPLTLANWTAFGTTTVTAIGLLFARDNLVSSEKAGATTRL